MRTRNDLDSYCRWLVAAALLVGLQSNGSADEAGTAQEPTTVEFPADYPATFRIIDPDRTSHEAIWTNEMRPAQGTVVIPSGKRIALRILSREPRGVTYPIDLSPLDSVDATALYALGIGMADIQSSELARLQRHRALQVLSVGGLSRIRGDFLAAVSKVTSLKILAVPGDTEMDVVTDAEFASIAKLTNLEALQLVGDRDKWRMTDEGLRHLGNLTELNELVIGGPEITDAGLKNVAKLKKLEKLKLEGRGITGSGLQRLSRLEGLLELDLSHTSVMSESLKPIGSLSNLRSLKLADTRVTGEGLKYLSDLDRLESLNLSNTEVQDSALTRLEELADLKYLDLSFTHLTDSGLKHLMRLKQLRQLGILQTAVTEESVAEFKQALPDCTVHFSRKNATNPSGRR